MSSIWLLCIITVYFEADEINYYYYQQLIFFLTCNKL